MSSISSSELAELLAPLKNPLAFAARNDFEKLERVKDLEPTLVAAAERIAGAVGDSGLAGRLRRLAAELRTQTKDSAARKEKLRAVLSEVERITRGEPTTAKPNTEQPPTANPQAEQPRTAKPPTASPRTEQPRTAKPPNANPRAEQPRTANRSLGSVTDDPGSERPTPQKRKSGGLELSSPVQFIKGIGPSLGDLFIAKGLKTAEDVLRFLPRRYEDRSLRGSIRDLQPGAGATIQGTVLAKSSKFVRGRRSLEVAIGDDTGVVRLTWFRVPGQSFAERFEKGVRIQASGVVKVFRGQLQMAHPETKVLTDDDLPAPADTQADLVPIYSEIEGLRPGHFRRIVSGVLPLAEQLFEAIPEGIRKRHDFPGIAESVRALHDPPKQTPIDALLDMATPWHRRLIYEELLLLQLVVLQRKAAAAKQPGRAINPKPLNEVAKELFPFTLTQAQQRVLREIEDDLRKDVPMHRLLQGDVGSGKTAVAMSAAAAAAKAGLQTAIMAPTELLAEQHARTALTSLPKAGVRVELLTGSVSTAERRRILGQLASGHIDVVVGTHAIIQSDVRFNKLALGIIDEQHRFGVLQRARLMEQGRESFGATPHVLVMTATPIPRTLALTVYGDLDVSVIDELPPGRTPIKTMLFREKQREQVYRRVRHAVEQGRQAYVVFPLVDESDKEGMSEIRAATSSADELASGALHGLELGVLHGQLDQAQKEQVMRAFLRKELDVLVATTVIEVGIDVPNATVMVIEHAERFGLSQLHQLRGRVGRGAHASECLLVTAGGSSDDAWRRLGVMEETSDGFKIAEADLEIRGPGDFVGTRQSGLPLLSLANLARDQLTLNDARSDALAIIAVDPQLQTPANAPLREALHARWSQLELAQIG